MAMNGVGGGWALGLSNNGHEIMEINDISGGLLSNSLVSPSSGFRGKKRLDSTMEMTIEWLSIFCFLLTRSTRCHVLSSLPSRSVPGAGDDKGVAHAKATIKPPIIFRPKTTQLSHDNGYKCRKKSKQSGKKCYNLTSSRIEVMMVCGRLAEIPLSLTYSLTHSLFSHSGST
jgi:hypothetical protein